MAWLKRLAAALHELADFTKEIKPTMVDVAIFLIFTAELVRFTRAAL
jgi:hypothetical protein